MSVFRLALSILGTLILTPAFAAPVSYEITGRLLRSETRGADVEPYIASLGFDGGLFTARVTLDTAALDSDPAASRALYAGAVTASSFKVGGFAAAETGYCNLDPNILDCSVVAADQHLLSGSLFDIYMLNSQVFDMPANPLHPAGLPFSFLTFDLSIFQFLAVHPSLFDGTLLDPDLTLLPGLIDIAGGNNGFHVDVRGANDNYGVFWGAQDLRITRVGAEDENTVPEPGSVALLLAAGSGLLWAQRTQARRHS